jgi:hypothetical protein
MEALSLAIHFNRLPTRRFDECSLHIRNDVLIVELSNSTHVFPLRNVFEVEYVEPAE